MTDKQRWGYPTVCLLCSNTYIPKWNGNAGRKLKGGLWLCPQCLSQKTAKAWGELREHLLISIRLGHEATLTMKQWQNTLDDFNLRCAYCLSNPYTLIEHFIPVSMGGGTTVKNCVPACHLCNTHKWRNFLSVQQMERVGRYLAAKQSGDVTVYRGYPIEASATQDLIEYQENTHA